jgi:D-amino-acid dehydrogenase
VRVVVVGAGVVGLCCAYELRRGGARVCVLDRGAVGHGASLRNTGWISPSFSYPLPAPGIIGEGLRGLLRGGPLVIHPRVNLTFLRWLLAFRRSATRDRWEHGVRALLALNARTLELFDAYAAAGVEFELHRSGLLLVATSPASLSSYLDLFRQIRSLGFEGEINELGPDEARLLEPALATGRLAGGVHARVDRYVRPESLVEGLARHLGERGVEVRERTDVLDLADTNEGIRVTTSAGPIEADRVVIAPGASSAPLLARLGVRMPLIGARGYSCTLPVGRTRPTHALYLADAKVGISSYEDSVRIAGIFELGFSSDRPDRRRLQAMLARIDVYFEEWRPSSEKALLEWVGLRPMTADGLPLIGRAPSLRNAFVAAGHGMLGVTLAPATAAALAPLVLEGRAVPELVLFDPARRI